MIRFDTDYMRGALPQIMERLQNENLLQHKGYGQDMITASAKGKILEICGLSGGEVYFLVGGTQTNQTVLDWLTPAGEGIIGTEQSHINVHEAGAVEATGHKVLALPSVNGKICPEILKHYLVDFYADDTWMHMVRPGCLYLSQPTELGTLYTLGELEQLAEICAEFNMKFYVDGARLAYGLAAEGNDVALEDLGRLADAFYIGGTKCGCLMGEAVIFKTPQPGFFSSVKRHGALLAKGWILGLEFDTLFSGRLYFEAGRNGVEKSMKLKSGFESKGYAMAFPSSTNQQFPILPNELIAKLSERFSFEIWGVRGETETTVRFVTDWATSEEDVELLLDSI